MIFDGNDRIDVSAEEIQGSHIEGFDKARINHGASETLSFQQGLAISRLDCANV